MLVQVCIVMITVVHEMLVLKAHNVGSVLFVPGDLDKFLWTDKEISLLKVRREFQDILPPPEFLKLFDDNKAIVLLDYFRNCYVRVKMASKDHDSDNILTTALSDILGGYLKVYVLPVAKLNYYGGTIAAPEIVKLFQFYDELKTYLNTDGKGWRSPNKKVLPHAANFLNYPELFNKKKIKNPCDLLAYYENSSEGLTIPLPKVQWNTVSSTLFVPLKDMGFVSMNDPNTEKVLINYYDVARSCLEETNPSDVRNFEDSFQEWVYHEVIPHLSDNTLYLSLGSILTLVSADGMTSFYPNRHTEIEIPDELKSKKLMIILIILFLEITWCVPALICIICKKDLGKKMRGQVRSTAFVYIDQGKPDQDKNAERNNFTTNELNNKILKHSKILKQSKGTESQRTGFDNEHSAAQTLYNNNSFVDSDDQLTPSMGTAKSVRGSRSHHKPNNSLHVTDSHSVTIRNKYSFKKCSDEHDFSTDNTHVGATVKLDTEKETDNNKLDMKTTSKNVMRKFISKSLTKHRRAQSNDNETMTPSKHRSKHKRRMSNQTEENVKSAFTLPNERQSDTEQDIIVKKNNTGNVLIEASDMTISRSNEINTFHSSTEDNVAAYHQTEDKINISDDETDNKSSITIKPEKRRNLPLILSKSVHFPTQDQGTMSPPHFGTTKSQGLLPKNLDYLIELDNLKQLSCTGAKTRDMDEVQSSTSKGITTCFEIALPDSSQSLKCNVKHSMETQISTIRAYDISPQEYYFSTELQTECQSGDEKFKNTVRSRSYTLTENKPCGSPLKVSGSLISFSSTSLKASTSRTYATDVMESSVVQVATPSQSEVTTDLELKNSTLRDSLELISETTDQTNKFGRLTLCPFTSCLLPTDILQPDMIINTFPNEEINIQNEGDADNSIKDSGDTTKPLTEILINIPEVKIDIDSKNQEDKNINTAHTSKIPKANFQNRILNKIGMSTVVHPSDVKRKSFIPQLRRKTLDDITRIKSPKKVRNKLNDSY